MNLKFLEVHQHDEEKFSLSTHSWHYIEQQRLEIRRLHVEHQASKWSYHRVFVRIMNSMTLKTRLQNGVQNYHLIMVFKEQHQVFQMMTHMQRALQKIEVDQNFTFHMLPHTQRAHQKVNVNYIRKCKLVESWICLWEASKYLTLDKTLAH